MNFTLRLLPGVVVALLAAACSSPSTFDAAVDVSTADVATHADVARDAPSDAVTVDVASDAPVDVAQDTAVRDTFVVDASDVVAMDVPQDVAQDVAMDVPQDAGSDAGATCPATMPTGGDPCAAVGQMCNYTHSSGGIISGGICTCQPGGTWRCVFVG